MTLVGFDLVGTLVKKEAFSKARASSWETAWESAERKANFPVHFDYREVFRSFPMVVSEMGADNLYERFRAQLIDNISSYIYADTVPCFEALSRVGISLAFVSDGEAKVEGDLIRQLLLMADLHYSYDLIITADQAGSEKKTGGPFKELARRAEALGFAPAQITFIGDSEERDVLPALREGMRAFLILRDRPERDIEQGPRTYGVIRSLEQLTEILCR